MSHESAYIRRSALFLDRDGTINVDGPGGYTHRIEDFCFEKGAVKGLQLLATLPYLLIVTTGQSGIGRGYYSEQDFHRYMEHMRDELKRQGVQFDAIYFCPHHPKHAVGDYKIDCACRKPKAGMIQQAVSDFKAQGITIDLHNSFVIGDKTDDGKMGNLAGCRSILVRCPSGKQGKDGNHTCEWSYEAENLLEAAHWIQSQHSAS